MRKATLFAVAVLAGAALALPGCCSVFCPCPDSVDGVKGAGPPGTYPGVVEIYREDGTQHPPLVGYVSTDPDIVAGQNVSWWLLAAGEEPPVVPASMGLPANTVTWRRINDVRMTGAQLCENYGANLNHKDGPPRIWKVVRQAPTPCP